MLIKQTDCTRGQKVETGPNTLVVMNHYIHSVTISVSSLSFPSGYQTLEVPGIFKDILQSGSIENPEFEILLSR